MLGRQVAVRHMIAAAAPLVAGALAVAAAQPAAQAATLSPYITYSSYSGDQSSVVNSDGRVISTLGGAASGCSGAGCAVAPASGSVALTISYPPGPPVPGSCRGSGSFSISWVDGTSSSGSIQSTDFDRSTSSLSGPVTSGTLVGRTLGGLVSHPPIPIRSCSSNYSFSGSLSFT